MKGHCLVQCFFPLTAHVFHCSGSTLWKVIDWSNAFFSIDCSAFYYIQVLTFKKARSTLSTLRVLSVDQVFFVLFCFL